MTSHRLCHLSKAVWDRCFDIIILEMRQWDLGREVKPHSLDHVHRIYWSNGSNSFIYSTNIYVSGTVLNARDIAEKAPKVNTVYSMMKSIMEKNKVAQRHRRHLCGWQFCFTCERVREILSNKMTFEQRVEGNAETSNVHIPERRKREVQGACSGYVPGMAKGMRPAWLR